MDEVAIAGEAAEEVVVEQMVAVQIVATHADVVAVLLVHGETLKDNLLVVDVIPDLDHDLIIIDVNLLELEVVLEAIQDVVNLAVVILLIDLHVGLGAFLEAIAHIAIHLVVTQEISTPKKDAAIQRRLSIQRNRSIQRRRSIQRSRNIQRSRSIQRKRGIQIENVIIALLVLAIGSLRTLVS